MFASYPAALVEAAVDPVHGLPAHNEFLPSLAKVKAFLEPRFREHQAHLERVARARRMRLPAPPHDEAAKQRVIEGFRQLQSHLKANI
jgi:hypothetical protein